MLAKRPLTPYAPDVPRHSRRVAYLTGLAFFLSVVLPFPIAVYFGVEQSAWARFVYMTIWMAWTASLMFPARDATLFLIAVTAARASQEVYLAARGGSWEAMLVGGFVGLIAAVALNRALRRPPLRT